MIFTPFCTVFAIGVGSVSGCFFEKFRFNLIFGKFNFFVFIFALEVEVLELFSVVLRCSLNLLLDCCSLVLAFENFSWIFWRS